MFAKSAALFVSAFAILAASAQGATTTVIASTPSATTVSQCNTGSVLCCATVQSAGSVIVTQLTDLLGIAIPDPNLLVGITCSPITDIGVGQASNCAQQPVCCSNNDFNGIISIGCNPISL